MKQNRELGVLQLPPADRGQVPELGKRAEIPATDPGSSLQGHEEQGHFEMMFWG